MGREVPWQVPMCERKFHPRLADAGLWDAGGVAAVS